MDDFPLPSRLRKMASQLRDVYQVFRAASETQLTISSAAEWLLDNFYVVERGMRQIREDMPRAFYHQLPKLEGRPRILGLAREMVRCTEGPLDLDQIRRFVDQQQRRTPLTMGELWALPVMLRLSVLERLTEAATRLTSPQADGVPRAEPPLPDDAAVANAILCLRMLATQDWKALFESLSQVEEELRRDPAGTYGDMDFATRDQYRKVVEALATATGCAEPEVARAAVGLAQEAQANAAGVARWTHVGCYLAECGRSQLEARLGYRPPWKVRLRRWFSRRPVVLYLGGIALLSSVLMLALIAYARAAGGSFLQLVGVGLLVALPAVAVAVELINMLVTHLVRPRLLPRMDYRKGIPEPCRTMVVIPSMLTNDDEVRSLLRQLELHYLSNADPHLHFALLTDFPDAPVERVIDGDPLLAQAAAGIRDLSAKYADRSGRLFYLFHRRQQWNPSEGCWMGWERKRGKLAELNRLLRGEETSFEVKIGDLSILSEIRYVITLDADTVLPRSSARRLIAVLAHPLNHAEFDPQSGAVVAGYSVLQPRVQVSPSAGSQSLFARVFSRDTGFDPYTRAVSDVYQDLFGEGNYVGKGIYDAATFERSLAGRVPENRLLSHDLFEGLHGRAALVSDVVLFEEYPPHYLAYARRMHRWIRGDWQLLPWLLPRAPHADREKTPPAVLTLLDRWKIFGNLERSLLAPALVALLVAGWLGLPGPAWWWTLVGILPLALPFVTGVVAEMLWRHSPAAQATQSEHADALRSLLAIAFLPYEALIALDAVVTTLVRLTITRKRLLEWTTAAQTVRVLGREMKAAAAWKEMAGAPLVASAAAVAVALLNPPALPIAAPLLLGWLLAPQLAYRISRPERHDPAPLSEVERRHLRCLARRTWLYYEHFVGPEDHWLPPDHFQEDPRGLVAHRTSPTNIGMLLLSTLAAHDLGYIGPLDLAQRLRDTLEGMGRLDTHRGHLLNWHDTRSLDPLPPRYVSVVDSGNLAGCLLALAEGCREIPRTPVQRWQRWQGLLDILDILAEVAGQADLGGEAARFEVRLRAFRHRIEAARELPIMWASLLRGRCENECQELEEVLISIVESSPEVLDVETLRTLRVWIERALHHLRSSLRELDLLLPWVRRAPALFTSPNADRETVDAWEAFVESLPLTPRLEEIPEACETVRERLAELRERLSGTGGEPQRQGSGAEAIRAAGAWCAELAGDLETAATRATALLDDYRELSDRAEACFHAMDFRFLFDPERQVFHIGYNVDAGKPDDNYYDLLASEARLASLLAIAKGDAPESHWLHLARPLTRVEGRRALLSWSGTMFEYLMPSVLVRRYEDTLLGQSCCTAVRYQIAYGRRQRVPWGISESSYYRFDGNRNYQYRAFGVPQLGFKRGLGEDLVVAPYASLLALPFRPQEVMTNAARLTELGMLGRYGFYEAVDFTASRLAGRGHEIVRSYMAHHQGMILLALANYLQGDRMVGRFHADPRVESVDLLLREQVPLAAPIEYPRPKEEGDVVPPEAPGVAPEAWRPALGLTLPQVHVLSNGHYRVLVTSAGGGLSRWREVDLTRWRADTTLDDWGTWIYVRDRDSAELWSACRQPTAPAPESPEEVLFFPHKVEFRRREHEISLRLEITVSPDDNVEIRRLTLINDSDRRRRLSLTSCGEVVLGPHAADQRHPAFNKLFIESQTLPELGGLLFRRRLRSDDEKPIYLVHLVTVEGEPNASCTCESDRARFLGRGGTYRSPAALRAKGGLSGTVGAVLDPIMALDQEIALDPHATAAAAFITLAAGSRQKALDLARDYRTWARITRAFARARARSEVELSELGLTSPKIERIQQLLSVLVYPHAALRASPATLAKNSRGQPGLWPFAISGDYPILLVRISGEGATELVGDVLQAHAYWRRRQLEVDLVILNFEESGYEQKLTGAIGRWIRRTGGDKWLNQRGGIFVLRADQMSGADHLLLETAARAILDDAKGTLADQLGRLHVQPPRQPRFVPIMSLPPVADTPREPGIARPANLRFDNALGGFSADGKEYVIYLEPGKWTPAPWINVIANSEFGFLVSEAGMGTTWAENSGENRLTPWHNDPVADPPGEAIYLRDEETGEVFSPTPLPARAPAPYLVRHGAGYSIFEHTSHGLEQWLRLFAVADAPVKVAQLRLRNSRTSTRRVTVTYYAEWVLGVHREETAPFLVPEFDSTRFALLVHNAYNEEFGQRVAFLAATRELHGVTTDRNEFLGRMGDYGRPEALGRVGLTARVKTGPDPSCAAVQCLLWLAPGEEKEVTFLLGQGADRDQTLRLIRKYQDIEQLEAAWKELGERWDRLLGAVTVRTPDRAMDLLLNRWLLYQSLSCRIWGRSALYQSSGAFGYRDQLQDVMALVHARPDVAREHIVYAARQQFAAGDVLHWWHPPSGRGVRTRCSDDLLWLPFVTAHYVTTTGDVSILREEAPFLEGAPLGEEEAERYGHYDRGSELHTIYEHCRRALDRGTTAGAHGLPLIGSHDWNDGMNRVGIEGRGESVWLGWFLFATLTRFAPVAELMDDAEHAKAYRQRADGLRQALTASAWDGAWYRRAFYDDGSPLGSAENQECQIDSIAQSWAVLSGAAEPARARQAMASLDQRLVREEDGLVLLFDPPFDRTQRDPGYIKGYLPGIRENGGQYTHAALWAVWAFAELGDGDRAEALYRMLNPVYHADTPEKVERYRVEPYAVAADVYSLPPHTGRGGWTWYTGSASWMQRVGVEAILGLRRVGSALRIDPCIPKRWRGFELTYRVGETTYQIRVENPDEVNRGVRRIDLDGEVTPDGVIPLTDDGGVHEVLVRMGGGSETPFAALR